MKTIFLSLIAILMAAVAMAAEYEGKSANEVAKELANPNTPLTSLKFKVQYRSYEGDLPNADDQDSTTVLFQPTLPFPFANDYKLWIRPAIPLIFSQPVFDTSELDFDSESGIGDMTIDFQYGTTLKSGFLWSAGATTTLPIATEDELGTDRWALGPGFQLGQVTKKSVIGFFLNHQWDVGGSGDTDISLTTVQVFGVYLPGGGWNMGSVPIISYDHEGEEWTIPINFGFGKTVIINGRPWKFAMEINYYVDQPDAFGPEWMIGFNIAPVVQNKLANWFK